MLKRWVVVDVSVQVVFYAVMVGSVFFLFSGHDQPGGGFVGGLVAGAAVALRYVAGGIEEVRGLTRFKPWTVLGTGLLVAGTTAAAPLLVGHSVLKGEAATMELPVLGEIHVSSTLVFDIGVYLLVLGLVLMVFEAFGGDEPR